MNTTLQRWGNSQGIRIPKPVVESMGLEVGAEIQVELSEDARSIVITPLVDERPVRGRHNIENLIAESAPDAFADGYDWGAPEGKEVW